MASVYKRGKQYWVAYYVNGRREQRSLHTANLRVARDKKRKIEYELAIGDLDQASKLPLVPVLEAFCKHLQPLTSPVPGSSALFSFPTVLF